LCSVADDYILVIKPRHRQFPPTVRSSCYQWLSAID